MRRVVKTGWMPGLIMIPDNKMIICKYVKKNFDLLLLFNKLLIALRTAPRQLQYFIYVVARWKIPSTH